MVTTQLSSRVDAQTPVCIAARSLSAFPLVLSAFLRTVYLCIGRVHRIDFMLYVCCFAQVSAINDMSAASLGEPNTPLGAIVRILNNQLQVCDRD